MLDSKIRITSSDIPSEKSKRVTKKPQKPLIPEYFKSIIKKDPPVRLVDNLRILTMKKILVDKLNINLAADYIRHNRTPQ